MSNGGTSELVSSNGVKYSFTLIPGSKCISEARTTHLEDLIVQIFRKPPGICPASPLQDQLWLAAHDCPCSSAVKLCSVVV